MAQTARQAGDDGSRYRQALGDRGRDPRRLRCGSGLWWLRLHSRLPGGALLSRCAARNHRRRNQRSAKDGHRQGVNQAIYNRCQMNKGTGVRGFMRQSIRASRWTILIALFLLPASAVINGAQTRTSPPKLELHKPIEATIAAGETRLYRLEINAKQFIRVRVQQRGINVRIALLSADGTRIQEADANKNPDGEESLAAIVETAGRYQIEVSGAAGTDTGSFGITLEDLRDGTSEDVAYIEVVKLLTEGKRLQEAQTREARAQSIPVYQRALE